MSASVFVKHLRTASNYIVEHRQKSMLLCVDEDSLLRLSHNWLEDLLFLQRTGMRILLLLDLQTLHQPISDAQLEQLQQRCDQAYRHLQQQFSRFSDACELLHCQLLRCRPFGISGGIDYQRLGTVLRLQRQQLTQLMSGSNLIWQVPVGYFSSGKAYACRTEEVLLHLAKAVNAEKIVYLSQQGWLNNVTANLPSSFSLAEYREQCHNRGSEISSDKDLSSLFASDIARLHLLDSRVDGCLLQELFTPEGCGMLIHNDGYDRIVNANDSHLQGIAELIRPALEKQQIRPRSKEDLDRLIYDYMVVLHENQVIGCAAVHALNNAVGSYELACLVIHPNHQGKQLAERLVHKLIQRLEALQARHLYALTTVAGSWFAQQGFRQISLDQLPVEAHDSYCIERNSQIMYLDLHHHARG